MAEFVMPTLGADMEAGTLVKWCKQPGEQIERGDIIAEIDTDKGVIEVECFLTGVIEKHLVVIGTKVPVGTPLALIHVEGEAPSTAPAVETERQKASPVARLTDKSSRVRSSRLRSRLTIASAMDIAADCCWPPFHAYCKLLKSYEPKDD
jgi:pyruvate/2-oxoglutarate dehydrogenase complex dihydrolipoamide acyltransferase (E2) component